MNETLRLMRENALQQRQSALESDEIYRQKQAECLERWRQFAARYPKELRQQVRELLDLQADVSELEAEYDFYTALQMGLQMRETDQVRSGR